MRDSMELQGASRRSGAATDGPLAVIRRGPTHWNYRRHGEFLAAGAREGTHEIRGCIPGCRGTASASVTRLKLACTFRAFAPETGGDGSSSDHCCDSSPNRDSARTGGLK